MSRAPALPAAPGALHPVRPTAGARLGERLCAAGQLRADELQVALREQARSAEPLGRILVRLGFTSEQVVCRSLAGALGQRPVDLAVRRPEGPALARVPEALARQLRILPLSLDADRGRLEVAMADPADLVALDRLEALLGPALSVRPLRAGEQALEQALLRAYGQAGRPELRQLVAQLEQGRAGVRPRVEEAAGAGAPGAPVVQLVDALLADALARGASDVHCSPECGFLRLRYRIDGVLQQAASLHGDYRQAVTVRLKVLAGMDITAARVPQDGRFSRQLAGRQVDFRVSSLPSLHGENLVLRVLERGREALRLSELGLEPELLDALSRAASRPEGLVLVSGPTGSGKTTTLYSLLEGLDRQRLNVMTLEDPVEQPMAMVCQSSLTDTAGLEFASGVRALLRQDPDVILIGEIRDPQTAAVAFRAAMTGHRVYSTLHAHGALGALPRLAELGVAAETLAGNLVAVAAQRLLRRLCLSCREAGRPDATERRMLGLTAGARQALYRPRGCPECAGQGYRGRIVLMELLCPDDEFEELLLRGAGRRALLAAARQRGFRPLAEMAVARVRQGLTSVQEVVRVLGPGALGP